MMVYGVSDAIRIGFWMFVISTIIIFLHDRVLLKEYEAQKTSVEAKEIFATSTTQETSVPVVPRAIVEGVPL